MKGLLLRVTNTIWGKVTTTVNTIWSKGIGDIVAKKRFLKGLLDLTIVGLLGWLFITFAKTLFVSIMGISLLMAVFGRMTSLHNGSFSADMLNPFIGIVVYAFCGFLFYWFVEAAILAAFAVIPCVTNEIHTKYFVYEEAMRPV